MTNIFSDDNKMKGNWVKFDTVGDKFQGTLVGTREVVNQLSGKDQIIYELRDANKEYWNVGGKPGIDMQMRHVKIGQIVGFEFVEERANKKPGMNATKIIQVYAKPGVVDEEFLQEEADAAALAGNAPGGEPNRNIGATPAATTTAEPTVDEKIAQIMEIAKTKWSLDAPEAVKTKVMEVTNLPFIEANLDKILEAIK